MVTPLVEALAGVVPQVEEGEEQVVVDLEQWVAVKGHKRRPARKIHVPEVSPAVEVSPPHQVGPSAVVRLWV